MENTKQEFIDICRKCADECTNNAKICREEGMDACETACMECADACNKVVAEGKTNSMLFEQCADACNACATECQKYPYTNCIDCAEVCRMCEEQCISMAA